MTKLATLTHWRQTKMATATTQKHSLIVQAIDSKMPTAMGSVMKWKWMDAQTMLHATIPRSPQRKTSAVNTQIPDMTALEMQ